MVGVSMGNYRRVAEVVDAIKVSDVIPLATSNWEALPDWVKSQYNAGSIVFGSAYLIINGGDAAGFESWLVQASDGSLKSCTSDAFLRDYEVNS